MKVSSVSADRFRSLEDVVLELGPGSTAIFGPNGSGKTNLLEAAFFGLTGKSFRTADRRDLIPFGGDHARVRITVEEEDGVTHEFMTATSRSEQTRTTLDGARVDRSEAKRNRPAVTVFSPERLELVKGPPALRRAHLDRFVGARWQGREGLRREFGRTLSQRNALLSSIARGEGSPSALATWDTQLAKAGASLSQAREDACELLAPAYRDASEVLGLEGENGLEYRPAAATAEDELLTGLEERRQRDIEAGRTTWGPQNDELRLEREGRQLRRFGSQGQQRLGLLALLFAERRVLTEAGNPTPLLLLDDVMSELDAERRSALLTQLATGGQAVISAAEEELLPSDGDLVRVSIESLLGVSSGTAQ
ncbi:MAG: DNA replication/repair protein RecF [Solirubrobacterales bacterium]